jgi:acyl-CoA reductase-like NAD-dependent aldehyde dehydrogenase
VHVREMLYIDGRWARSTGSGTIAVFNSATEEVIGTVPDGTPEDVDRAVRAASNAFPGWSRTSVDERSKLLARTAELLAGRREEIANLVSQEVGMPFPLSLMHQAGAPTMSFALNSQIAPGFTFEEEVGQSLVVREPVGVVGCITPWNYPLGQISDKVAPALAAGCTVVVKASEVAPLNAFILAEVFDELGLPPGVFNLVMGTGPIVGEALASHPLVDMVSFTGSTRAGRRVMELAANSVKRVALELGGKSPNVILEDADLSVAVPAGVAACYENSGQICSALSRMIVPSSRLDEAGELAVQAAGTFRPGDPFAPETTLGPLVSAAQRDRVRGYIKKGIDEGATLLCGGVDPPTGLDKGYYVQPTVFSDVTTTMTIAQQEIFGPVLAIMPYDSEEEAVTIANDTVYGLSGGVWSGDKKHAEQVARRLRTGQVAINGADFNPIAPFGGYKQSGIGRELGTFGLQEFLEVKALQR